MQFILLLLGLYFLGVLVIFPIWAWTKLSSLTSQVEWLRLRYEEFKGLRQRHDDLVAEMARGLEKTAMPAAPPAETPAAVEPPPVIAAPPVEEFIPTPEPAPVISAREPVAPVTDVPVETPPPPVVPRPVYTPPPRQPGWLESINWEQFMGAKLFAWLGGLALFLGVAFFVKYSFDHGWVPAEARAALGFIFSAGLVVGGLRLDRSRYKITSQTLIGAGVVSLYAVTFACRAVYHFPFFGVIPTFLLMALITAIAFVLSVRLQAQVISILGLLGGFLTPVLLSTGVDNPVGLFGYLALLDIGLAAVALHRRWFHLVPMGAAATVFMMIGWADKFYAPEKTGIAMTVSLLFSAIYFIANEVGRRLDRRDPLLAQTAISLPAVAFGFAWFFLNYSTVAVQTGLFIGFVLLASLLVFALAWREEKPALVAAAAGATIALLTRWGLVTFSVTQAPVIVAVCLGASALYFAVYLLARRLDRVSPEMLWSAIGLPVTSLLFALPILSHDVIGATQPGLIFGFIFGADLLLLALAWLDDRVPHLHLGAGLGVFGLLAAWTMQHLNNALLPWALGITLLFAALHTAFSLVLERRSPKAAPDGLSQVFPPLALLLVVLPLFKLETASFLLWPAILLIDVLAIGLAAMTASLAAVGAVLVLTLVATATCIFKVPAAVAVAPSLLLVIGFFAVFFFVASLWLVRRLGDRFATKSPSGSTLFGDTRAQLPAFASLLPFLLLMMVCGRLTLPDPSAVFGLGLLLVVLTLGLARMLVIEWLPACALAGMAAGEFIWHGRHFDPHNAGLPLMWYGILYTLFAIYPFLYRRKFAELTGPWCVAALSGLAHFWMSYDAIKRGWPGASGVLGLVPALFALAPLASLGAILKLHTADNPRRLNQLAWFGGIALLFITLVFPIQFDNQWLTVAWAFEGAALLWLFRRVPHPGLPATGAALLVTAFIRLGLNPEILSYQVRSGAFFNWYLYAYGLTIAALFAAARLAAPPRERVLGVNVPPVFQTLATILAFLLLNLEIANFFTAPGARSLTFQFSGNFARDMSYTIGWSLFALGLLAAGLWQKRTAPRYAALTLLSVALLKLFFHDLARLEALYRVGALFAVAAIAIVASVAYQRFLPAHEKSESP